MDTPVLVGTGGPAVSDDAGRQLARRLVVAAALALLAAVACYLLMVRTTTGQRFDDAALAGAFQQYPAERAASNRILHAISADSFTAVLALLVAVGVLRHRVLLGLAAAASAGISVVGVSILKHFVLTRPDLVSGDDSLHFNTFPSGHTATAVSCALALMLVVPPRWRGVTAVVAGFYAWGTAAQVQTAGWHRPSDAIGGALLAFAVVALVGAACLRLRPADLSRSRAHRPAVAVLALVGAGSALVAAVEMLRVLDWLHHHAAATAAIRDDAYVTGVTVTVLVVVCTLTTLLALLGTVDLDRP
jgi:membrane-associated phospholipid phosphatase